ncbi:hypothetical protein BU16DRAFT_601702 [Lophium mytilinum]|uniref:Uncharacterized protein n=1 Tax=Lophium mytilinum TaxID=390894 RepID=A0A6A6R6T2_9PEZI|nr:hypothetical protein BU16DRAFT_601702 [Lophium mytilinum]
MSDFYPPLPPGALSTQSHRTSQTAVFRHRGREYITVSDDEVPRDVGRGLCIRCWEPGHDDFYACQGRCAWCKDKIKHDNVACPLCIKGSIWWRNRIGFEPRGFDDTYGGRHRGLNDESYKRKLDMAAMLLEDARAPTSRKRRTPSSASKTASASEEKTLFAYSDWPDEEEVEEEDEASLNTRETSTDSLDHPVHYQRSKSPPIAPSNAIIAPKRRVVPRRSTDSYRPPKRPHHHQTSARTHDYDEAARHRRELEDLEDRAEVLKAKLKEGIRAADAPLAREERRVPLKEEEDAEGRTMGQLLAENRELREQVAKQQRLIAVLRAEREAREDLLAGA